MIGKVFLSASIPVEGRPYYGTTIDEAIVNAVLSFTRYCAENNIPFYFGGHPAITPLVWDVAKHFSEDVNGLITIYQSEVFKRHTPKEVEYYKNVVWTPEGNDVCASVVNMRREMFCREKTLCAVFVGGMDGVVEEYKMLKEMSPETKIIPIKSVGGASAIIYEQEHCVDMELANSFAFAQMFKRLLGR